MNRARRVVVSDAATLDLEAIYDFVCRDSRAGAVLLVRRLRAKCGSLGDFPGLGRSVRVGNFPEREVRRVLAESYQVYYSVQPGVVTILRIWHSARRNPTARDLRP